MTCRPLSTAGTRYASVLPTPVGASTTTVPLSSIRSRIASAIASWASRASQPGTILAATPSGPRRSRTLGGISAMHNEPLMPVDLKATELLHEPRGLLVGLQPTAFSPWLSRVRHSPARAPQVLAAITVIQSRRVPHGPDRRARKGDARTTRKAKRPSSRGPDGLERGASAAGLEKV